MLELFENERLDDLDLDNLKIIQNKNGYCFSSDSVLLANFVEAKHKDICVEIGTGCGVISVLVNYKEKPKQIFAFEIQKNQSEIATRNFKNCNMDNIQAINDDVLNYKKYLNDGSVDVVFSNPPYFKYDKNVSGDLEEKVTSRSDKYLPNKDFFKVCSKILKYGGKLFFVFDSQRIDECFINMKEYNLSPKKIYFVHPNQQKNSSVFLCMAIKGGKQGVKIMPPLFTNDLDGNYIQTIQKLYKNNK